ncbi:hypothetical protein [Acetobacter fallax]|uniref:Uncharacterized protein n=1 Tax=Acetobacter fallax TaxID=1737473 RepID=A0ABX0KDA3_9PROT|nr:hypothetical protein [Acetobacter fallax]NHO32460.1 hypothetical protein [Acetobacter fallax]NHO36020.1 hypothetical protein [Acetobacter fallax]
MSQQPDPLRKARPEAETTGGGLRAMVITVAGISLLAGGGFWLNNSSNSPSSAPPVTQGTTGLAQEAAHTGPTVAAQFALIAPEHAAKALRDAGYSASEQAKILAGIKRREYRLVNLPFFDAGGHGGAVSVQSGPVTRVVLLSQKPVSVILPILISGEVQVNPVSDPGVAGVEPGALTILGPMALPAIHRDEYLTMTVIAQ